MESQNNTPKTPECTGLAGKIFGHKFVTEHITTRIPIPAKEVTVMIDSLDRALFWSSEKEQAIKNIPKYKEDITPERTYCKRCGHVLDFVQINF